MRLAAWSLSFVLLCACGDSCSSDAPPKRFAQATGESTPEPAPKAPPKPKGPPPEGTPVATNELAPFLAQDKILEYTAKDAPRARKVAMDNQGILPSAKREYVAGDRTVKVEVTDTRHAPGVRELVEHAASLAKDGARSSIHGTTIQGERAISQWHGPSKTAIANVLVEDRFLVSVHVVPADDPAPAREVAQSLPFALLRTLRAKNEAEHPPATAKPDAGEPQAAATSASAHPASEASPEGDAKK